AWLLTVRPELYLVLLAGAIVVLTGVYLTIERLVPMYPPPPNRPTELEIAVSRAANRVDGQHYEGGGQLTAAAAQDAQGEEIGDRSYSGAKRLREAGGWLNRSSPVNEA